MINICGFINNKYLYNLKLIILALLSINNQKCCKSQNSKEYFYNCIYFLKIYGISNIIL